MKKAISLLTLFSSMAVLASSNPTIIMKETIAGYSNVSCAEANLMLNKKINSLKNEIIRIEMDRCVNQANLSYANEAGEVFKIYQEAEVTSKIYKVIDNY